MDNDEKNTVVPISPRGTPRRKPASGARKKPAARKPRTAASRRKTASSRRSASRTDSLESLIRSITGGASIARAAIAEASGQGATAVRKALGSASTTSRRTVTRLAREWKAMDPRKKAGILATLLGAAAAAASAPLVRKSFKK